MTPAPATPETAALTCPRRRNTYLPGTIHNRLQITADLDACAQNGTTAATAPEGLFCGAVPARAGDGYDLLACAGLPLSARTISRLG